MLILSLVMLYRKTNPRLELVLVGGVGGTGAVVAVAGVAVDVLLEEHEDDIDVEVVAEKDDEVADDDDPMLLGPCLPVKDIISVLERWI